MSYAEELLVECLRLVLHPNERLDRNLRPDFLENPFTGHNLELDVYLPRLKLGIEVQGPQHVRDPEQRLRDEVKRTLCGRAGVHLLEISIFEVRPLYMRAKLLDFSREHGQHVNVQPHDPDAWSALDKKVTVYRSAIMAKHGPSPDYAPPQSHRERLMEQNRKLARCLYVVATHEGREVRARPVRWGRKSTCVTVRILGEAVGSEVKVPRSLIRSYT